MPNADFYSIQIVSPEYKPTGSSQLEDYLKKEAEGGVKPEDNENTPPPKVTELYDAPIDRVGGAHVDSKWGEEPNMDRGRQEPFHQNDTTRSPSAIVQISGNSQPSSPTIDQSKKSAILARPSMRPHAGSMNTQSSVKKSPIEDHGTSPRCARVR